MNLLDETRLVDFLEAVYALELSDQDWLTRTLEAFAGVCGPQHDYEGLFYDASNVDDLKRWNYCRPQPMPPGLMSQKDVFVKLTGPEFVRATFRALSVGSGRRAAHRYIEPVLRERERNGWGDFFYVNALDPSGIGCTLTLNSREPEIVTQASDLAIFRRLASHLGAAFRCRRRLAQAIASPKGPSMAPEAIVDPNGRVLHAEGAASSQTARQRIQDAVTSIESARTRSARRRGSEALERWHPLTSARWTLVDSFEESGKRYVVARENRAEAEGFAAFTDRERQVVVHAALGMTNKEIAYALGISDATVRVLMARAASRLGVHTRKALLDHATLRELRPTVEAAPLHG